MSSNTLYRLPASIDSDLAELKSVSDQFAAGDITAARFQAFRVPQGVYEQRENGTFMLRARLPAGILTAQQMRDAADVARRYGDKTLHLTSRQDLQIHGVTLAGIHPAVVALTDAGLATKGGGGNTVRNIAACYQAGVCPKELFDVTPHVFATTEALLPDPLSFQLPRKYKIAFSGCPDDCAGATINDLGFISRERHGIEGFAVYAGGGLGAHSRVGQLLDEFIPATDAPRVAEALKRVFDKHGNRKNRHRARLRFLLDEIGIERLKELYNEELATVSISGTTAYPQAGSFINEAYIAVEPKPGFAAWRDAVVVPQKQSGYHTVEISPALGNIDTETFTRLAAIIDHFGDHRLRVTNWQNALLRWVSEAQLPALHAELAEIGLAEPQPAVLRRMVTCAGASTCRLGICQSRGVSQAIRHALVNSGLNLSGPVGNTVIHISGCPNSCGRHPIAQIGLFGAARRVNGRVVPHYVVQLGGHVKEGSTQIATGTRAVPARAIPAFLTDVFAAAIESQAIGFDDFLANGGRAKIDEIAARHSAVPPFEVDASYYTEWGATEPFSLAGRGAGECGAGVFDLIELDLAAAREALETGQPLAATIYAARALLVTRGQQANDDRKALELFGQLFVNEELVPKSYRALIDAALAATSGAPFDADRTTIADLIEAVRTLYATMGPSLRLPTKV
ncbi:MAG TPA: nitrite/sulfite reductase [Capsulimonadaceae bacterium]